jgi:hypothetical protein
MQKDWPLIGSTALSIVAGFVGAVLWNGIAKPARDRRILASTLLVEIELLAGVVSITRRKLAGLPPRMFPMDLKLPNDLYLSVLDRIGELPPALAMEVVKFYSTASELLSIPPAHATRMDELDRADSIGRAKHLTAEDERAYAVMQGMIDQLITRADSLFEELWAIWSPWWTLRRYRTSRPQLPSEEHLTMLVASAARRRARAQQEWSAAKNAPAIPRPPEYFPPEN